MRVKTDITVKEVETILNLENLLQTDSRCACGDETGIAGMCDDCFNLGCQWGKTCEWGETGMEVGVH